MRNLSIKYQVLIIAMVPVFLIDVFLTLNNINNSIVQAENLLQSKGQIIARQIAGASEFNLFSGNHEQIQYLLDQSINTNDIIYAAVYDSEGNPIAKAAGDGYISEKTTQYFYYRQAIQSESLQFGDVFEPDLPVDKPVLQNLGWVHLNISKQRLEKNKQQIYIDGAIFFCAMLVIAMILTLIITQRITRPIFKLLEHLKQVETGQLGQLIDDIEGNEIGDVQKGFNSMSQSLLANRMQLDQKIKNATLELMNAITDLEYKNRELAVARDSAQKADQLKSQFLANISHEIRTPINGIKGFVNLLSKTGLSSDQQRYADIISQSTTDLTLIVNEVLDFSKLESGNISVSPRPFNLHELLETTRDSLFPATLEKNIDLHLIIYGDIPKTVIGDELRIKQILINLIGNAIKFTDQGYVSISVLLEEENDNHLIVRFDIKDSGIGVSPQDQALLFQAFHQIDSDSNRRYSGTGLGLVISKNLATLMGGDVEMESGEGKGSKFSLVLPLKVVSQTALEQRLNKTVMVVAADKNCLREVQTLYNRIGFDTESTLINEHSDIDSVAGQLEKNLGYLDYLVIDCRHHPDLADQLITPETGKQVEPVIMHYDSSLISSDSLTKGRFLSVINTSANLRKLLLEEEPPNLKQEVNSKAGDQQTEVPVKSVLIVDDNPVNLMLASELVSIWGPQSVPATNADEAMDALARERFDLILLDIQMPEVDGVTLMKMIRDRYRSINCPIVALTANIMPEEEQRLIGEGFDGFISKPIDEERLSSWIKQPPVSKLAIDGEGLSDHPVSENPSIDYATTLKLAANKQELVKELFDMLGNELPGYRQQMAEQLEYRNLVEIARITHKLHGITCYTGLPKLKALLKEYDDARLVSNDATYKVALRILPELFAIEEALTQFR